MKFCPICQADVEGLINRCDCCGASLKTKPRLFVFDINSAPECLGLARMTFAMVDKLEPTDLDRYQGFLQKISLQLICFPDSIMGNKPGKDRVIYSAERKRAYVTVHVDYDDYLYADRNEKAALVVSALHRAVCLLQVRFRKRMYDINEIVVKANALLNEYTIYINNT